MMPLKILALSAISDRIGLAVLHGEKLKDWHASERAAINSVEAAAFVQEAINYYRPNVVVTEKLGPHNRKGKRTQRMIAAMQMVAEQNYVLEVQTDHRHPFATKYEEAQLLAKTYPPIGPWLPAKRRYFDHQPRAMVMFEALSLAHSVARGSAEQLAAAM